MNGCDLSDDLRGDVGLFDQFDLAGRGDRLHDRAAVRLHQLYFPRLFALRHFPVEAVGGRIALDVCSDDGRGNHDNRQHAP